MQAGNQLRSGLLRIGADGTVDEWRADDASAPAPPGQVGHLAIAPDGSVWLASPRLQAEPLDT